MSANPNGVKNLRAMFENKGDQSTSPPSRGRSPNPSEFSNGSRPVSKVRASFIAVERPGENGGPAILGLRRASEVSSMSGIQENAIMEDEGPRKSSTTTDSVANTTAPLPSTKPSEVDGGGLGNILKGSAFVENTPTKPSSATTDLGHAITSGRLQQRTPHTSPSKPQEASNADSMIEKMQQAKENKPNSPTTTTLKTTEGARPVKAPPTRQINSKAVPKSPIVTQPSPRTPTSPKMNLKGGPAKIRGVMDSAKEAQKSREATKGQNEQQAKSQPQVHKVNTQTASKPTPVASKKEQTPTSPTSVRSPTVPKPKSTTISSKLPAAVTATTASAAAKHDAQQSPAEPANKPAAKKSSTIQARPPRASMSSTTSTLAKKASRGSLTNGHQRPQSRVSTSQSNEGFLARMMRPTTSSAQKTHDKVQTSSPPRKTKAPASTKAKPSAKQEPPPRMGVTEQPPNKNEEQEAKKDPDEAPLPKPDNVSAVAEPTPVDTADRDPPQNEVEETPADPEPIVQAEQPNGDAQEVY